MSMQAADILEEIDRLMKFYADEGLPYQSIMVLQQIKNFILRKPRD